MPNKALEMCDECRVAIKSSLSFYCELCSYILEIPTEARKPFEFARMIRDKPNYLARHVATARRFAASIICGPNIIGLLQLPESGTVQVRAAKEAEQQVGSAINCTPRGDAVAGPRS